MLKVRKSHDRGHSTFGWLDSYHTFSFGEYQDRLHMGFRTLRVVNEDRVSPGKGFGTHPHNNMEILSIVLSGQLEHRDSMGTGSIIKPKELQLMSAGRGVSHSEFNPSSSEPVHFYQIWIRPEEQNLEPSYQQRAIADIVGNKTGLQLVVSADGKDESLHIHQDVNLYWGKFEKGDSVPLPLVFGRFGWIQCVSGNYQLGSEQLSSGDGVAISEEQSPVL